MSERSFPSLDRYQWDNFALISGGSFLGSWAVLRARRLVSNVKFFEFFLLRDSDELQKIGQCAISLARGKVIFLDRIHLKSEQKYLWDQCLKLIIQRFGVAIYDYGSHWNHENRCELGVIPDFVTQIVSDKQFHVDLIDFDDWDGFPAYRRDISENIRRDYKKAQNTSARVVTRFGLAALVDVFALVTMRSHVMRKHQVHFSRFIDYFVHAAKLAIFGRNAFITTVRIKRKCYSAFFGVQWGSHLYYVSGGTIKNRLGFGSYLFLTLIENWFLKHSDGKLVMGCGSGATDCDSQYWRKLRVKPVSGVQFQFQVKPIG